VIAVGDVEDYLAPIAFMEYERSTNLWLRVDEAVGSNIYGDYDVLRDDQLSALVEFLGAERTMVDQRLGHAAEVSYYDRPILLTARERIVDMACLARTTVSDLLIAHV